MRRITAGAGQDDRDEHGDSPAAAPRPRHSLGDGLATVAVVLLVALLVVGLVVVLWLTYVPTGF